MGRRPKTLGIIGGIAPPSTVDYYRQLTTLYRERSADDTWPSLLIDSLDGVSFFSLVSGGDRAGLIEFLVEEVERLARAGADLALFASNTPHLVFEEVAARAPIRLLSIVEAVADEAQARGFQTLGLLGARITVEADFYPAVFARRDLSIITPDADDRRLVDDLYFGELVRGSFRDQTREEISVVVDRLAKLGAEAVVLGGTELPLLFRDSDLPRLPTLDTTAIHVARAVEELLLD